MKFLRCLILSAFVIDLNNGLTWESSPCHRMLNYVEDHLPHFGVLRDSGEFVYVEIDDAYIHKLISFIPKMFQKLAFGQRKSSRG